MSLGPTQVPDEAPEVHQELHVWDEEAVDFGHVSHVLQQRAGAVGAKQAVCDGDGARQGARRPRRAAFLLLHQLLFIHIFLHVIIVILIDILPLLWRVLHKHRSDTFPTVKFIDFNLIISLFFVC